jgi:hypothetical protein
MQERAEIGGHRRYQLAMLSYICRCLISSWAFNFLGFGLPTVVLYSPRTKLSEFVLRNSMTQLENILYVTMTEHMSLRVDKNA